MDVRQAIVKVSRWRRRLHGAALSRPPGWPAIAPTDLVCWILACARKSLEEEEVDGELKPSIEPSGTIPPGKG